MVNPYLYVTVGVIAAVTALLVWWNTDTGTRPLRANRSETSARRRTPEPDSECMICCDKSVDTKFLPCQHACMCKDCAQKYIQTLEETNLDKRCPYCRKSIHRYEVF